MAKVIKWKGSKDVREDPESPVLEITSNGSVQTRIFNGSYAALNASIPPRFSSIKGSGGLLVDTVRITKQVAGRGKMTITLTEAPQYDLDQPVPELEWMEVSKPLTQHPRYLPGGLKALDDDDLDIIEEWKSAATAKQRSAVYARIVGAYPEAKDLVDKLKRGQESFVEYAPVVRLTTKSRAKPNTAACGKIDVPPGVAEAPRGYVYLKTADRRIRQDRIWQRVEEWTGAAFVDTDIYN